MLKNISILAVCVGILVACGSDGVSNGLKSLGADFARIFAQDRNDEPIPLDNIAFNQTPEREPFNP